MYRQILDPVGDSLTLSAVFAALPLATLFLLLGVLRLKAWISALAPLGMALLVAIVVYSMPVGQALLSGSEGAAFGFFPILWIVLNAIWVYNLTVHTGHFAVLRRSFERVSPDLRIQAIIIAFCFGALLEALAGFGTPVAITVVMLMGLGIKPVKAATVALIANTAPVAFGALATPIVTLATVTSGVSEDKRLTIDTLGAMVGRQTPLIAVFVPLVLVYVVDGRRGLRQTWLPALTAGLSFGLAQFVAANYISVPLTDIVASLVAAAAVVGLLRAWSPVESPVVAESAHGEQSRAAQAAATGRSGARSGAPAHNIDGEPTDTDTVTRRDLRPDERPAHERHDRDTFADEAKAYAPYLIIIAIFSIANLGSVKAALGKEPWTHKFSWPGLDVLTTKGEPVASATFTFNWLPAAGTLMLISGILTALLLRVSPGRALSVSRDTYVELRWAMVTVMAVLALAYVMNQSAQTNTLGAFLAQTGGVFVLLSPLLGWLGVAVTGSDTSANALFGALQVQTAAKAGLDPLLLAAANTSGGVMGKMVSPQNLAIAAAAVGMHGHEGALLRKVLGWSLLLLLLMCLIVGLQSTSVLGWMVP